MYLEFATSLFFIWILWYILTTYLERRKMPPGPFPLPFIGNLLQMGPDPINPFKHLTEKYGEILSVSFPLRRCVIINNAKLAREARLTRKNDLAGKVPNTMYPGNVIFGDRDVICSDYGPGHTFCKKILMRGLHVFGAGIEQAEERVHHAVEHFVEEIEALNGEPFSPRNILASAILCQLWEWVTSEKLTINDPKTKLLVDFNNKIATLWAQFTPAELIPGVSYLPTTFNRTLKEVISTRDDVFSRALKEHRERYTPGITRDLTDGFLAEYLKEMGKENGKDIGSIDDIQGLMVDIVFAGSDTTSSVIAWLILYLVLHQNVQTKIHEELDRVVPMERSPGWQDAKKLHYLQASLCEVLRVSRILPVFGTNATRDTIIGGYHVPKGTYVALHINKIHFDENEWPEPHSFKPERFLDDDGKFVGWTAKHGFMPFGLGRRECPGQSLARIMLVLFASSLLHRFKVEVPEGEDKPLLLPSAPKLVLQPKDYRIVAKQRKRPT